MRELDDCERLTTKEVMITDLVAGPHHYRHQLVERQEEELGKWLEWLEWQVELAEKRELDDCERMTIEEVTITDLVAGHHHYRHQQVEGPVGELEEPPSSWTG